jgi:type II secretory pathway pseudopilin PulG
MVLPRHDRRRRPRPTRGFTLVELITAASLMTLMMMGVVQIFAIVTETAAQAQGNAFALEQGRALMDAIHRDIRGFDRLGYFKIQYSDTDETGVPVTHFTPKPPLTRPAIRGLPIFNGNTGDSAAITWYSTDCLALSTIGYQEGQWPTILKNSTGAEVVYTANVKTPINRLVLSSGATDPRRGLVSRSAWLISPTPISGGQPLTGGAQDSDDMSQAKVLADLESGTSGILDRLDGKGKRTSPSVSFVTVNPTTSANPIPSSDPWQVRRVAASCTSEFLVECLDLAASTLPPVQWTRKDWSVTPTSTGTVVECPRAIRVTVAIHDPGDKKPATGASKRYEGFALQEIFWIGDP